MAVMSISSCFLPWTSPSASSEYAIPTKLSPVAKKPIRKIPGDYGLPLLGAIRDRYSYFYGAGDRDGFLLSRIRQHNSTVLRLNVPPGPPISPDSRVVAVLDAISFPVLFDTSLVEKRDVFTGTFMPDTALTGGFRVLSYLDPSEPNHSLLKKFLFFLLSSRRAAVIPEFRAAYSALFDSLESDMAKFGKADFGAANDAAAFNFLCRAWFGRSPAESTLGSDGPNLVTKWVLFQLSPLLKLGLPSILEDSLLHTFRLPPALVKKDYARVADFFRESATGALLDEAERMGIGREEAVHNLVFATCFNTWGGMKILFPTIVKCLGRAGSVLHGRLADEIRSAVAATGGQITMATMERMPLMMSVVYEALRLEPPVPIQFGRAKKDMVIESHDAGYEVKAGEMLFGYQPFATKDPRIFDLAEEFVADRFVGEKGEELLKYVVWSNGPETASPTADNKQCAGKNFVVLVARLLVVELFLRYDSFDIEVSNSALGSAINITSLKRATF